MSQSLKLGVLIILGVLGISLAVSIIKAIIVGVWHLVFPLAIVVGLGLIVYGLLSRKPLGGGRRYLP